MNYTILIKIMNYYRSIHAYFIKKTPMPTFYVRDGA